MYKSTCMYIFYAFIWFNKLLHIRHKTGFIIDIAHKYSFSKRKVTLLLFSP